jgi:hypothetical protein
MFNHIKITDILHAILPDHRLPECNEISVDTVLNYVAEKKPHERTRQAKSKFKTKILLQHV